jgi:two-component system LytT family response regulator
MRVLIVDAEPLARRALENVLREREDVEAFDSASDAIDAQEKLSRGSHDVVLLDINVPELSGLAMVDQLKRAGRPMPCIIFVTAHDDYAIAAFERHAADYVLKPFSAERIDEALDVARRKLEGERAAKLLGTLLQLQQLEGRKSERVAIRAKGRILFLNPAEVVAVEAEGNYVLLQRESGSHLLRESISSMAEKLKAYGFIRIHRSVLVNASFVHEIQPWFTGEYALRLKGGREYTVTRTYKKNLKSLADSWIGTDTFLDK